MFQTKNFVSIVAGMLNRMRGSTEKITDFQVGSVARTLIEGPATEIDQLYQQMFIGLREAIPISTFLSFGFNLRAAAKAIGTVTVSRSAAASQDMAIPAGTVFTATDGRRYVSRANVTWLAAATSVEIQVEAESAGAAGNAASGSITASQFFTNGEEINGGRIVNGRDIETDSEREVRFADYIASLSRGTVDSLKYAASQAAVVSGGIATEYVTVVGIDERPGFVRVYIYSSAGLPSAQLIAIAQLMIDGYRDDEFGVIVPGYRAGGVRVDVLPAIEVPVAFSGQVSMFPGYDLDVETTNLLHDAFSSLVSSIASGETLFIGSLVERMLAVPGVRRVVPDNDANIVCLQNQVLKPGAFSVSELNG